MRPRSPHLTALATLAAGVILVVTACGSDSSSSSAEPEVSTTAGSVTTAGSADKLVVASTVSPITNIVSNIGGDRVTIEGIVPEGTNSHTFEPAPSVAKNLAAADIIFMNGLKLEEPTKQLAEANKRADAKIVELGPMTITEDEYIYDFSFPKDEGKPNPHLWTNPPMAKRYAEIVANELSAKDPANAAYYQGNYEKFAAEVDTLDVAMRTSFATVPAANRKLLTYHDAYAYFAKEYGWEVIGAIQVSDFEDPTPKEVADLIKQVKALGVPAIFGSEVFPSPVLAQIGKEAGVTYVDKLRDDDLPGAPGDPEHSLLGLLQFNYSTMTSALGGDPSAIDAMKIVAVAPDQATYPQ